MTREIKLAVISSVTIITIVGAYFASTQIDKRRKMMAQQAREKLDSETKLKQAEIEGTYPPEYWVAKKAEAEADAEVRKAEIESQERLKIDQRDREDADRKAQREFEKDAPESYWQHKRFKEEEETKRRQLEIDDQRRRRLEEQERDIAAKQARSLEEGTRALEKALRTANYASTMFGY